MITVHHLENSRSHRVLWLLEELGLDYELKLYRRDPNTFLAPAELKQVHPLGKAPVIRDGDDVIAESGAIIEYVVGKYGEGRLIPPPETPERPRYTYWLHAAEASVMPFLVMRLLFTRIEKQAPLLIRPIAKAISARVRASYVEPSLAAVLGYIEAELARSAWFAGEAFSAADIQMGYPAEAAAARMDLAPYPKLRGFLDAIRARPAYQAAVEKGGPLMLLTR